MLKALLHGAQRRLHYALGFDNSAGIIRNLGYARYHRRCQEAYASRHPAAPTERSRDVALAIQGAGFHLAPPTPEVVAALEPIRAMLDARLDDPANRVPKFDALTRYYLSPTEFDLVRPVLDTWIGAAVAHSLRSDFAVASAYVYRTEPSGDAPRSSWLWHSDEHPDCCLKLFVYLTDTTIENGAMQVHTWPSTRDLKRRGFADRRSVGPTIQADLDDPRRYVVAEGARGSVAFFCANAIHRAIWPKRSHRDLLTFELAPCPSADRPYLAKPNSYWDRPDAPATAIAHLSQIGTDGAS